MENRNKETTTSNKKRAEILEYKLKKERLENITPSGHINGKRKIGGNSE